jgi:error-prone DNA polymerase
VFQIESRAQMSMLPRLRPRCFYDLVVEVALVRPGPIQGDMVHPYLRRRNGEEPVEYPDDAIRKVLGKTLGVPLFQEQAMSLAVVAAGFTPGQADELRRAIAAWKRQGNRIAQFGEALESGMLSRGYSRKFALQVFEQIKGFSGYGFPESHAASFALLVYASSWLKRHHPAAFAASLLNSQPMGFYAPAQILRDARDHGVAVRGVDVHCSLWDSTLERGLDLARDLARDPAPVAAASRSTSSCRRTQQELDEAYIRMRVQKVHVRNSAARGLEHWNAGWRRDADASGDARACDRGRDGEADFIRLHSRGRSVLAASRGTQPFAPHAEPLCAPSSADDAPATSAPRSDAFHVPSQPAIRLGLRMVRGLDVEDAHRIIEAVARHGAFRRMSDLLEASGASVVALRRLAAADAFLSMGLDRQQASWQILALRDHERPLWSFAQAVRDEAARETPPPQQDPHEPNLPAVGEISDIAKDFEATGVTLKRHPIACIRERLQRARVVPCGFLRNDERTPAGRILSLVGLVLVRQRPSTAKGIVFMTIEDETGVANLIFRPKVYERLRSQVRHAVAICVRGKVERRDGVTHLLVANARDVTASLAGQQGAVSSSARDFR